MQIGADYYGISFEQSSDGLYHPRVDLRIRNEQEAKAAEQLISNGPKDSAHAAWLEGFRLALTVASLRGGLVSHRHS